MQKLFIQPNPTVGDSDPARHHIWLRLADGTARQVRFTGFSFYGEINGLRERPTDKPFVDLVPDGATVNEDWQSALSRPESIRLVLTYGQWIAFLAHHRVNHSRIFCFPEVEAMAYPFARYPDNHPDRRLAGKYTLENRGRAFFQRLTAYLTLARRKGIVVHVSFASVQSLRRGPVYWGAHPFNADVNVHDYLDKDRGLDDFCVIEKPTGTPATVPQKLYAAQERMVKWIVQAAKPFWNVMFELFNEPSAALPGAVQWHATVAEWVHEEMIRLSGQRTHLVTLNAPPDMLDAGRPGGSILRPLLVNRFNVPLVDVHCFHGDQWGGDSGARERTPEARNPALPSAQIRQATIDAVHTFYERVVARTPAGTLRVKDFPLAVICDGDAHYRAQDNPAVYSAEARKLKLSYIHRWNQVYLKQRLLKEQAGAVRDTVPVNEAPTPDPTPAPALAEVGAADDGF